jgi:hypothetical protein
VVDLNDIARCRQTSADIVGVGRDRNRNRQVAIAIGTHKAGSAAGLAADTGPVALFLHPRGSDHIVFSSDKPDPYADWKGNDGDPRQSVGCAVDGHQ